LIRHLAQDVLGAGQTGSFGQNRRGGPRHDLDGILGTTASTCTQEDLGSADLIVLAGADPSASHPVLGMAIRRAARRGAEIIAINSSPVDLVGPGDLWIDCRRGTSGMVYAAMLHHLLKNGPRRDGIEALQLSVAAAEPAKTAPIAGVDQAKIEACADRIAAAKRVVAVYDLDETLEKSAADLQALAQVLILTNHLGRPGEGLLLLQSDCNGEGARLAGIANPVDVAPVRSALVIMENPYGDYRAAKELCRVESLVVIDHFLTETARMADVVLPAATLAESDGTVVSFDGKLGMINQASRPIPGWTTLEVLAALSKALGQPVPSVDPMEIRAQFAALLGIPASDLEAARDAGAILPRRPAGKPVLTALRLDTMASVANVFPYASLDAILDKKLAELNLAR
jgi:predicted molibdopterin-dependent oxidoreductase YjgC